MGSYPEYIKRILTLAVPIAAARLLTMASTFVGMLMLARLGPKVLAASALITATQVTIFILGASILFATSVVIGQLYGADKKSEIGVLVQQAWVLALLISVPMMFLYWNARHILLFMGQKPELVQYVHQYFHAYIWNVIPYILLAVCYQFSVGILKQKWMLLAASFNLVVFVPLAYALIFGKFGMPALGVSGMGYAIAVATWLTLIGFVVTLCWHRETRCYRLLQWRIKNWQYAKQLLSIGWPMSVQYGGELVVFFILSMMVGWLGTHALAAYQVVGQFLFLLLIPLFGVAASSGVLIGHAYGAKRFHEVKDLGYASVMVVVSLVFLIGIAYWGFPNQLASIYMNVHAPQNAAIVHYIKWLFILSSFSILFDSIRNTFTGALRGLYDTRYPMIVGILCLWGIALPLAYFLSFTLKFGVYGIRGAVIAAVGVGSLLLWRRWQHRTQLHCLDP